MTGDRLDQARRDYERELAAVAAAADGVQHAAHDITEAAARLLDPREWHAAGWTRVPTLTKRYGYAADYIRRARLTADQVDDKDET